MNREKFRYLAEIKLPKVSLSYEGKTTDLHLTYQDCRHLFLTSFRQWKQFLMRSFFRLELNIHTPIPLKAKTAAEGQAFRIIDNMIVDERDEDIISEASSMDYAKKFPPAQNEILSL